MGANRTRDAGAGASGFFMAHYLSQPRIEGPIWLEPTDISFLQTRIAETEQGVETLEEQISELTHEYERLKRQYDSQLSELIRIKDAKLVEISSFRNTLSPIRRIPVEILSEILELSCIPAGGVFTFDCDAFLCASLVSSVCVAWRRTALADAQMWSTICFCLRKHREGNIFMGLREWISRSQGHPLDLHLDLYIPNNPLKYKVERTLECILDSCHQIRSIQMRGFPTIFLPLFRLPRSSLPLLERVLLDIYGRDTESAIQQMSSLFPHKFEAFLGAPKLQHFSIREYGNTSILQPLELPHEQLASLEIRWQWRDTPFDLASYQHTLCQCKNLVSFTTDFDAGFGLDFSVCLLALKTLNITCWEVFDTTRTVNLLHGLTTPLLEHLTIHWRDQDIQGLCTDLLGLQSRSSVTLSSLRLIMDNDNHNSTPAEDFVDCFTLILAAFPTVKSFWIREENSHRNRRPSNALIRSMMYTRDRAFVLPNLTYFELCINMESKDSPDIAPMLSSRRCSYKPDRVLQNIVSRFQWGREPMTDIGIMEDQCILP